MWNVPHPQQREMSEQVFKNQLNSYKEGSLLHPYIVNTFTLYTQCNCLVVDPSRRPRDISYHPGRAWSFSEKGQDNKTPSLQGGVGDDLHKCSELHGTCGKRHYHLGWWWLGMETFLLKEEQQSSWEKGENREKKTGGSLREEVGAQE